MDVVESIYDQVEPPKALLYIGLPISVAVFIGTAHFTDSSAPFFAAVSVGIICLIIGLTWPLRRRWLLWVLIGTVAVLHVAALLLVRFPAEVSFGISFAPLGGLDTWIFWRAIIWILRKADYSNGS